MRIISKGKNVDISAYFTLEKWFLKQTRFYTGYTHKKHYHAAFEIHFIIKGEQKYFINNKEYNVCAGSFLYIPSKCWHRAVSEKEELEKITLIFTPDKKSAERLYTEKFNTEQMDCFGNEVLEIINKILKNSLNTKEFNNFFINTYTLELIVTMLKKLGLREYKAVKDQTSTDARVMFAKDFIVDNIEQQLTLEDVSKYCYLSKKQLTRLFLQTEGITLVEFIVNTKIAKIEELLAVPNLSLREISEKMHFNNEYYFNTFFKKYAGMPPGEYRKNII